MPPSWVSWGPAPSPSLRGACTGGCPLHTQRVEGQLLSCRELGVVSDTSRRGTGLCFVTDRAALSRYKRADVVRGEV